MLSSLEDDAEALYESQQKIRILVRQIEGLLPEAFAGISANQAKVWKYLAFIARWSATEKQEAKDG